MYLPGCRAKVTLGDSSTLPVVLPLAPAAALDGREVTLLAQVTESLGDVRIVVAQVCPGTGPCPPTEP